MAKESFIALDVTPLSQNSRRSATVTALGNSLISARNLKYGTSRPTWPLSRANQIVDDLQVKCFYIHKDRDKKDADNISKPLWDSLNKKYYDDDKRIKYLETLKISNHNESHWNQFDINDMEDDDLRVLYDFLLNKSNTNKKLLYVRIEEYDAKKVRF